MKSIYTHLISFSLGCIAVICFSIPSFDCGGEKHSTPLTVHDTTVLERYQQRIDTVTTTLQKIAFQESEPSIVFVDKVRTEFIERTKDQDLMLGFEKRGSNLRIFAVNQNDSLLKEALYENVYNDFSAYSADKRIHVESRKWYFNGVNLSYTQERPINNLKTFEHSVEVMTGINYKNMYYLDAGAEYNLTNKDIKLKLKGTVRVY